MNPTPGWFVPYGEEHASGGLTFGCASSPQAGKGTKESAYATGTAFPKPTRHGCQLGRTVTRIGRWSLERCGSVVMRSISKPDDVAKS